ncbi:hypothetical protein Dsin_032662 [Dipteronia sinensis]|uniref:Uncharacterized protein n=1 Tax=Dipteronia sinensis TaxID=43782 RepID=A0AAD9Z305_9ROSI|nr:hypothetical protein Dsin_032662 [Dipteronia sinensis]
MGRDVVFQESVKEPGKRSRLWDHQDICDLFKKNTIVLVVIYHVTKPMKSMGKMIKTYCKLSHAKEFLNIEFGIQNILRRGLEQLKAYP